MNDATKAAYRLVAISLCSALFFQGCAYPPPPPVHYPPPQPVPEVRQQSIPDTLPVTPPPRPANTISADFSRQAQQQMREGKLELAATTLERGLRLAPKNAMLWSQLAEIRLQQQDYQQARALAAKSTSLAGSNDRIIQKNQWLMREALKRSRGYK